MHVVFALDLSDIDLGNMDLLDTHLYLLDTDIPSKHIFVSVTSSRRFQDMPSTLRQDMSSRRLEDVFSITIFCLARYLQDVFKMSSRRLEDETLLRWRRVEDVFKTCLEDICKTSWKPSNICWDYQIFWTSNFLITCQLISLKQRKIFWRQLNPQHRNTTKNISYAITFKKVWNFKLFYCQFWPLDNLPKFW